jgi:hypothetical protein
MGFKNNIDVAFEPGTDLGESHMSKKILFHVP